MGKMKQRLACPSCYRTNKDYCTGACFVSRRLEPVKQKNNEDNDNGHVD